jgi:hypothetical protein
VDEDQIPCFLGGTNPAKFTEDVGPWKDYKLVDSTVPGETIGVRRRDDLSGKIFTHEDFLALENPMIKGLGVMGCKGALKQLEDGTYIPFKEPNKTMPIEDEKYCDYPI